MTVSVLWLFLMAPWVGLHCVIVVFPHHTHSLFGIEILQPITTFFFINYLLFSIIDINVKTVYQSSKNEEF